MHAPSSVSTRKGVAPSPTRSEDWLAETASTFRDLTALDPSLEAYFDDRRVSQQLALAAHSGPVRLLHTAVSDAKDALSRLFGQDGGGEGAPVGIKAAGALSGTPVDEWGGGVAWGGGERPDGVRSGQEGASPSVFEPQLMVGAARRTSGRDGLGMQLAGAIQERREQEKWRRQGAVDKAAQAVVIGAAAWFVLGAVARSGAVGAAGGVAKVAVVETAGALKKALWGPGTRAAERRLRDEVDGTVR